MPDWNRPGRPPAPGPREPITRVKQRQRIVVVVLSSTWWDIVVHWDPTAKRSFPCTTPTSQCEYHQRELPSRWRGYLHVLLFEGNKRVETFLELTPGLAEEIENQLGEGADLRGQRWELERGNGDKARITLSIKAHWSAVSKEELAPERSPEMELMRLWGMIKRKPSQRDRA